MERFSIMGSANRQKSCRYWFLHHGVLCLRRFDLWMENYGIFFPSINLTNLLMASGELTERAAGGGSVWDIFNLFV